ncbi:response regulator transcription factor [Salinithrix halophila]|uniref:Response regulator transcription factor n=1 Tax=Salinithrix halophila TaxID=1485204 RepID=A0ABV8JIG0_9BACL
MKVLLLEDDPSIRSFVKVNLKRQNFHVLEATTGEEALACFRREPDVALSILDVMLPGVDGFEVCRLMREHSPRMGIIMLTAKGQEKDKVEGFDCGADDYVAKPFSPAELMSRVKALVRRLNSIPSSIAKPVMSVPPFSLSLDQRKLFKSGEEIEVTPKEYDMIRFLMERADTAVSRDEILDGVWGEHYIGDLKTIDIHIRRLRKKIEKNPSNPVFIETIWGYGYMWRQQTADEKH